MYSCNTFSPNLVPIGSRQIEFLSNSFLLVRSQLDATIRIVRIEIANASRYFAASFNRLLYQQLQCGSISREKRSADICTAIFVHNGTKNVDTKGKREIAMHLYLRVQRVSALHQRSNLFKCRDEKYERLRFGKKKNPLYSSSPFFPNKLAFEKDQRSKCSSKFLTFNDVNDKFGNRVYKYRFQERFKTERIGKKSKRTVPHLWNTLYARTVKGG